MDWQAFQAFVGAIQEDLLPGFVAENVEFEDDKRGIRRQLDAVLRNREGAYRIRIMIEATTRAEKVSLDEMDAFITKARNLDCQKMVVVSATGFTQPALDAAKSASVEAWVLREIRPEDLEGTIGKIGVDAQIEVPGSHSFNMKFKQRIPPGFEQSFGEGDRDRMMVYAAAGEVRGNIWDFVKANSSTKGVHSMPLEAGDFMLAGGEKYELASFQFVTEMGVVRSTYDIDLDEGLLAIYQNAQDQAQSRLIRWRPGFPASFEGPSGKE